MIDERIWNDQAEFNAQVHRTPTTEAERIALVKEFTLHMVTELAEFLTASNAFGAHRRPDDPPLINGENVRRQLVDAEKYWIMLCQAFGYSREQMEETYWRKSATVRQRHAEEWLTKLTGPVALLDLDGVLCDYYAGIFHAVAMSPELNTSVERLSVIQQRGAWVNHESLGITLQQWNKLNHEFRSEGGFRRLPPMPLAKTFLQWCRIRNLHIVVMTSRAIDQYPNIYDDTVAWFKEQGITCDRIWWGPNKAEKLASVRKLLPEIAFAVDDDPRYVQQFVEAGVQKVFWYKQAYHDGSISGATTIYGLDSIIKEMTV